LVCETISMSKVVIKAEDISKQYRLGEVGTGALAHDVNRWLHRMRGREDPYLKIGDSNDRTVKGMSEYVWALKDINFEVKQGDVLGIIGRNGAGKSTLLKILSKTTTPTTGQIKIKGRIASLLEVGTGFHPELSGRDNIFLNGAILGMTKREIKSKFDEIVDFAGVERHACKALQQRHVRAPGFWRGGAPGARDPDSRRSVGSRGCGVSKKSIGEDERCE
jgi:lipopolysaccharide transport system ATP-binding protein